MSTLKSLRNHLKVLTEMHRVLDKKVTDDQLHHLNDEDLRTEKYEKLELKREIAELEQQILLKEENGD